MLLIYFTRKIFSAKLKAKEVSVTEAILEINLPIDLCYHLLPQLGDVREIFPINQGQLTYVAFSKGYSIFFKNRLLEVGEDHLFSSEDDNYYLGPNEYFKKVADHFIHLKSGEVVKKVAVSLNQLYLKEQGAGFLELGKNLVKKKAPVPKEPMEFIGISEKEFLPYKNITTPSGKLCGSYASVVLFSYLQDHLMLTLPTTLRKIGQKKTDLLAEKLIYFIQKHGLPTVPFQVALGWKRFFHYYHIKQGVFFQNFGARKTSEKLLQEKNPFLLGVLRIFRSEYGNHWVVCYAYGTYEGQTFYKIHDNWGNYEKIIAATLGNGIVAIENNVKV